MAPESNYSSSRLQCVSLSPGNSSFTADAMPAVCGQQQQQVLQLLLPEPTIRMNSGGTTDMQLVSSSWQTGLVASSMAPAVAASTGGMTAVNSLPMQLQPAIAMPQVLVAVQPVPGWPNTSAAWQQLF
jgi:hypothetical protein